ncbi:MAG: transglycosylase SLT domain-containing protein [Alphaproteobacteria bacterium]|nr:transglycosylase SLT domain-containing protein [Alphaproteobacteria bacterium]MCW5739674.1 transglycosylase SLT domain-containing protein [Alphaproteobacteria bacterium]
MAAGIRIAPYQPAGVSPQPVPGGGYQNINAGAGDFGQGAGAGLEKLGAQGRQMSRELRDMLLEEAARDNEAAAYDVERQFRGEVTRLMADPANGFLAQRGRDAIDRFKGTFDELEKLRAKYTALGRNEDQKRMIDRIVGAHFDSTLQTMNDHTRTQRQAWQTATFTARADDALRDGAAATDDKQFLIALTVGEQAVMQANAHLGDEVAKAQARKYRGAMFKAQLEGRLPTDPDGAAAWYAKHRAQFDPLDTDRLDALVKASVENRAALRFGQSLRDGGSAGGVYTVPSQFAPDVDAAAAKHGVPKALLASTIWNESRWNPNARNRNDQGPGVDSVGLGQWGEQWARARGFDPKDPKASIEHTAQAMKQYADKYGGNWLLARLAYGWGPGNVDKWLAAGGDPEKIPDGAKVWLPRTAFGIADDREARAAFPRIADKLKPGQPGMEDQPVARTTAGPPPEPRRADYLARVDALGIADPQERQKYVGVAEAEFGRAHALWKERMDKALDDAVAWVGANPGQALEAMPAAMWLALDPKQQASIRDLSKKVAKGTDTDDDEAYYALHRMATSDNANERAAFAALNLLTFRAKLSKSSFDKFVGMQGDIRKGDPDGNITGERTLRQMQDDALRGVLGLDPTPKKGTDAAKRVAAFRRAVDFEVARSTREKGKKLTLEETQAIVDRLAKPVSGTSGFFGSDKARFEVTVDKVPREMVATWDKVFAAEKVAGVTDDLKVAMFAATQMEPDLRSKPEVVAQLVGSLRRQGKPVTEVSIVNAWRIANQVRARSTVEVPSPDAPPPVQPHELGAVILPPPDAPPPVTSRDYGQRTGIERAVQRWWDRGLGEVFKPIEKKK